MKIVLIPLYLAAFALSSFAMTGCVVHDRDRVVYDRDHPRYVEPRVIHEEDHHDAVRGDVRVDVRP